MKETEYKHCKRDMYGAETCDEIIQKYVTEEPAQEWEKLSPQPAAYRQDMTAEQLEPRFRKQGQQPGA
jgi:hypothetical protein